VVAHPLQRLVGPAGGTDHDVHPGVDQGMHVLLGGRRHGEVDRDLCRRGSDGGQVALGIDLRHQLGVRSRPHGLDDGPSHPPCGAEHRHPDRLVHGAPP
jgi:hypothetical protein